MKKLLLIALISGICAGLFAQLTPDKPERTETASPDMQSLQLATSLAKYGYENFSASALIEAAEILINTQTQPLADKPTAGAKADTGDAKTEKPELTAKNLLADAKKFAKGDSTMLAWIKKAEKSLATQKRGAIGGPREGYYRVYAYDTHVFQIPFRAGYVAEIIVCGDGDTDLDLYVYDSNGNFIAGDDDYYDDCYVSWVPRWNGAYTIRVVNRGRFYNQYLIVTN